MPIILCFLCRFRGRNFSLCNYFKVFLFKTCLCHYSGMFAFLLLLTRLKGTVSRDFWPFFTQKFWPKPHMNRLKRFRKLFSFRKDIWSQRSKISKIRCPCSQQLHEQQNFSLDMAVFKFLNYCYWMCSVNTPKYLFLPDCSFNICEKPSKFSKSVCVFIDVSA